jgi:hypothetical protein
MLPRPRRAQRASEYRILPVFLRWLLKLVAPAVPVQSRISFPTPPSMRGVHWRRPARPPRGRRFEFAVLRRPSGGPCAAPVAARRRWRLLEQGRRADYPGRAWLRIPVPSTASEFPRSPRLPEPPRRCPGSHRKPLPTPKARTNPAGGMRSPRCYLEFPIRAPPGKAAAPSSAVGSRLCAHAPFWELAQLPRAALRESPTCSSRHSASTGTCNRGS